jgi:hypothetical protein
MLAHEAVSGQRSVLQELRLPARKRRRSWPGVSSAGGFGVSMFIAISKMTEGRYGRLTADSAEPGRGLAPLSASTYKACSPFLRKSGSVGDTDADRAGEQHFGDGRGGAKPEEISGCPRKNVPRNNREASGAARFVRRIHPDTFSCWRAGYFLSTIIISRPCVFDG